MNVFQFNRFNKEWLNLKCAKYPAAPPDNPHHAVQPAAPVPDTTSIEFDMRVVYAMHMYFLANAELPQMIKFLSARHTQALATRWALHLMRHAKALCRVPANDGITADHPVFKLADGRPVEADSPEDLREMVPYYIKHTRLMRVDSFLRGVENFKEAARLRVPADSFIIEDMDVDGETFWATDSTGLTAGDLDTLLAAVHDNTHSVNFVTICGKQLSIKQAARYVRSQALNLPTQTMTRARSVATAGKKFYYFGNFIYICLVLIRINSKHVSFLIRTERQGRRRCQWPLQCLQWPLQWHPHHT